MVHNGVIENFEEVKARLQERGYSFRSETDTEVISNLLQYNYEKKADEKGAMIATLAELEGRYSFVAMFENGVLAAARHHNPLVIGVGKDSYFLSSDVLGSSRPWTTRSILKTGILSWLTGGCRSLTLAAGA